MTANCCRLTDREEKILKIYAGNLSYETREQDLKEAFEAHGEVKEVEVIKDRDTGRSKGFAFVEMPSSEEAQAAITSLNGRELAGRTITVNEAKPRVERGPGGGGYGNRGGGGGGGYGGGGGGGGYGGGGGGGGDGGRGGGGGGGGGRRDGGGGGGRGSRY